MKHVDPLELGAMIANDLTEARCHVDDGFTSEAREKIALAALRAGELTAMCSSLMSESKSVEKAHISKLQKKLNAASVLINTHKKKNEHLERSNRDLMQRLTDKETEKDKTNTNRKIANIIKKNRG